MNNIFAAAAKLLLVFAWLASVLGAQAAPPTAPGAQATSTAVQRTIIGKSANIPLAQSQDSDTVKTIGDLRKQATGAGGTTRIIVGVRVPFAAEGLLLASEATLQRDEIAAAHANVLDKLPAFKQKSKAAHLFESIPFMTMEVTAAELEALLASTEITSIQEDRPSQLHLAESVPIVGGTSAWSSGYTGAGQTVAILDSGVDKSHSFLTGKVVSEACYSKNDSVNGVYSLCPAQATTSVAIGSALPYGTICVSGKCDHGTHVAGIAAGSGASFSGVAKGASIIAIQVFSRVDNSGALYCNGSAQCVLSWGGDRIKGLEQVYFLRNTFNIASVNMSIGGGNYLNQATCDADNLAEKAAIDNLRSVNIATVISSGNDGYTGGMGAPGCISSAVSVGATWDSYYGSGYNCNNLTYPSNYWDYGGVDKVACFSNSASFLNLLAPGVWINSSIPFGLYINKPGTSMAAPHVAGAWALLKQKKPTITVTEALAALTNTGQPITDTRNGISKPRINVNSALASIVVTTTALPSAPSIGTAVAGNGSISVSFTPGAIGTGSLVTYWAACSKDGTTFVYGSGSVSPVLVNSLTSGQTYSCLAQAQSTLGYGAWSTVSNSVVVLAACSYSLAASSVAAAAGGLSGTVGVGTTTGCAWSASSNAAWITITGGSSGTGNGTVVYAVASNTATTSRTGTLTIAGQTFTVTQAGSTGGVTTVLQNGVAVTGLSGALGSSTLFSVAVPSGATNLVITTSGGTGDADLYVRLGQAPTTAAGTYDCSSRSATSVESCSLSTPTAGTYYVLLYGYSAYSGVTVRASYTSSGSATSGNDTLTNGTGNNTVDGLAGLDTYVSTGAGSNYYLSQASGIWTLTDRYGSEGTDTLTNIERLRFSDGVHALDIGAGQIGGTAYRIYKAAFNRTPDNGGLKYWMARMDTGTSLTDVAWGFIASAEFELRYGRNPTDGNFVTLLYLNVLGRGPDSGGYAYWINRLATGSSRQEVLIGFSESAENMAAVAPAISNGIWMPN